MMYLSDINRIHNCWNRFGKEYVVSNILLCQFFSCSQQLKITKLHTRENFKSTRKNSGPQNTHRIKFWTHEILARKNVGTSKYSKENILNPLITTRKYFELTKHQRKNNFGTIKYPRRHDGTMALNPQDTKWHATHGI